MFALIRLISEALQKMKGKMHEIAGSHVSSRVLQVCVFFFFSVFGLNEMAVESLSLTSCVFFFRFLLWLQDLFEVLLAR